MKQLLFIALVLFTFNVQTTPTFAANDSSACSSKGATTMDANNQFKMVCNGFFWESCGFSPQPAGCTTSTSGGTTGDRATLPVTNITDGTGYTAFNSAGTGSGSTVNVPCSSIRLTGSVRDGYTLTCTYSASSNTRLTYVGFNPVTGTGALGGTTVTNNPLTTNSTNYCGTNDRIVPLDARTNTYWPKDGQVRPITGSGSYGSYNAVVLEGFKDQTIAFKVVVPYTFTPALNINHLGLIRIAEVPGGTVTSREYTVSKNPCDFQSGSYLWSQLKSGDTAPTGYFTVNNPNSVRTNLALFNLQSGDTVYVNVRNRTGDGLRSSCDYATCDILFDFAAPERY